LMVGKVLPDWLGTQRLLINSFVIEGATLTSVGVGRVEIIRCKPLQKQVQVRDKRGCLPDDGT
jgi:hypothetical protein